MVTEQDVRDVLEAANDGDAVCLNGGMVQMGNGAQLNLTAHNLTVVWEGGSGLEWQNDVTDAGIDVNGDGNVFIGGTFKGPSGGGARRCFRLNSVDYAVFDDIRWYDFRWEGFGYGVNPNSSTRVFLKNCWAERCRHVVSPSTGSHLVVENCSVVDATDAAIDTHQGYSEAIVRNNYVTHRAIDGFDWTGGGGAPPAPNYQERDGIILQNGTNFLVDNNLIDLGCMARHGIEIQGNISTGPDCVGTISNNTVWNVTDAHPGTSTWAIIVNTTGKSPINVDVTGNVREVGTASAIPGIGRPGGAPGDSYTRFSPGQEVDNVSHDTPNCEPADVDPAIPDQTITTSGQFLLN